MTVVWCVWRDVNVFFFCCLWHTFTPSKDHVHLIWAILLQGKITNNCKIGVQGCRKWQSRKTGRAVLRIWERWESDPLPKKKNHRITGRKGAWKRASLCVTATQWGWSNFRQFSAKSAWEESLTGRIRTNRNHGNLEVFWKSNLGCWFFFNLPKSNNFRLVLFVRVNRDPPVYTWSRGSWGHNLQWLGLGLHWPKSRIQACTCCKHWS